MPHRGQTGSRHRRVVARRRSADHVGCAGHAAEQTVAAAAIAAARTKRRDVPGITYRFMTAETVWCAIQDIGQPVGLPYTDYIAAVVSEAARRYWWSIKPDLGCEHARALARFVHAVIATSSNEKYMCTLALAAVLMWTKIHVDESIAALGWAGHVGVDLHELIECERTLFEVLFVTTKGGYDHFRLLQYLLPNALNKRNTQKSIEAP